MEIKVLILGKSGAGKSSVLNYLWGIEKAETGIGKPVTEKGQTGIHTYDSVKLNGHDLVISDSWGLEADKADEWLKTVMPALEKHEASPNVEDWFHTVIYCIGASSARIEPFETREVVSRLQKAGHTVIFALTKADRASKEELAALRKTIGEDIPTNGGIIEIETSRETLRNGTAMQQHGKEELLEAITKGLTIKLQRKLALRYMEKCREYCAEWKAETLRRYDKEAGFFTRTSKTIEIVKRDAGVRLERTMHDLEDWRKQATAKLEDFQRAFGEAMDNPISGKNISTQPLFASIDDWGFVEHAANVTMYLIPVIGQIWPFVNQGIHRDNLEKRLDEMVAEIERMAKQTTKQTTRQTTRQTAFKHLLTIRESVPPDVIRTSTSTRPESSIRIMEAISGKHSN